MRTSQSTWTSASARYAWCVLAVPCTRCAMSAPIRPRRCPTARWRTEPSSAGCTAPASTWRLAGCSRLRLPGRSPSSPSGPTAGTSACAWAMAGASQRDSTARLPDARCRIGWDGGTSAAGYGGSDGVAEIALSHQLAAGAAGNIEVQIGELGLGLLLSAVIGLERELSQKSARLRIHSLAGVGAALFMLVSKYGFSDVLHAGQVIVDPSR